MWAPGFAVNELKHRTVHKLVLIILIKPVLRLISIRVQRGIGSSPAFEWTANVYKHTE
jgi:hypothetical protein